MAFISKSLMYDEGNSINFEDMQVFIGPTTNYLRHFKSMCGNLVFGWFSVADSLCKLLENIPRSSVNAEGLFKVDFSYVFGTLIINKTDRIKLC